jgi:hypothetical protein
MHFCKAVIALGEDRNNTVVRNQFNPISWPEVEVIRALHGDASVLEIIPFVAVAQTSRAERQRLAEIYGDKACSDIWGGRAGPLEMEAPEATLKPNVTWMNPITHGIEVTGGKGDGADVPKEPYYDEDDAPPFDGPAPATVMEKPAAKKR